MSDPTCALPGCEKEARFVFYPSSTSQRYCSLSHAHYHERDKQTAAWHRQLAEDGRAIDMSLDRFIQWHEDCANAIDAGEHHE